MFDRPVRPFHAVIPGKVQDGFGEGSSFFLVELPDLHEQLMHDIEVGLGLLPEG